MAAPSSYQGPRAEQKGQQSASQDAHIAFEKAYSQTTVGDILEEKDGALYSVTVSSSLASVIAELNIHEIGNLPVIDPNVGLVGVISERDIIRATGRVRGRSARSPGPGFHDRKSPDLLSGRQGWRCDDTDDRRALPAYACRRQ